MNQLERLESLKAGTVGAISVAIAFSLLVVFHHAIAIQRPWNMPTLPDYWLTWHGAVSSASAVLAGFLFGITYRYIIRTDENSHLKSGAVLAFGIVRGLAQVDTGLAFEADLVILLTLAIESISLFAVARLILDLAIDRGLVKPFG